MRMIKADDLEQALREAGFADVIKDDCSKCTSAWGVPIVDAVPVIRCKDCVYFWDGVCTAHTDAICTDENEFCSWGERR